MSCDTGKSATNLKTLSNAYLRSELVLKDCIWGGERFTNKSRFGTYRVQVSQSTSRLSLYEGSSTWALAPTKSIYLSDLLEYSLQQSTGLNQFGALIHLEPQILGRQHAIILLFSKECKQRDYAQFSAILRSKVHEKYCTVLLDQDFEGRWSFALERWREFKSKKVLGRNPSTPISGCHVVSKRSYTSKFSLQPSWRIEPVKPSYEASDHDHDPQEETRILEEIKIEDTPIHLSFSESEDDLPLIRKLKRRSNYRVIDSEVPEERCESWSAEDDLTNSHRVAPLNGLNEKPSVDPSQRNGSKVVSVGRDRELPKDANSSRLTVSERIETLARKHGKADDICTISVPKFLRSDNCETRPTSISGASSSRLPIADKSTPAAVDSAIVKYVSGENVGTALSKSKTSPEVFLGRRERRCGGEASIKTEHAIKVIEDGKPLSAGPSMIRDSLSIGRDVKDEKLVCYFHSFRP
ncbi:hypothetical protein SCHPADRAFT_582532 [Schizopora paradoxa]|uniref:Uncharacterized protein n=1 Tax=Schizopora paradoxa TaxID=27342 RepID=A0A0H2RC65_9AGAM|nr:hypothetical protein SCHPADRAFT_582532 [Schizopora paradoxa]